MHAMAKSQGIQVQVDCPLIPLQVDRDRVIQTLTNLTGWDCDRTLRKARRHFTRHDAPRHGRSHHTAKAQRRSRNREYPIIILTAKAQTSEQRYFCQLEVAAVITKPYDPLTLSEQISTVLL